MHVWVVFYRRFAFMFQRLRQKWKLSTADFVVVMLAFALGGSLCGYITRKLLVLFQLQNHSGRWPVYALLLTATWPFCVLLTGHLLGKGAFFRNYLLLMWRRITGNSRPQADAEYRLAIFASGGGSNARVLMDYFAGHKHISVALLVCNKPGAGALQMAAERGIATLLIEKPRFATGDGYSEALKAAGITHLVLAGFLWKIPPSLVQAYPNSIVNIHPALLPLFGGKGMYGHHVHAAVLAAGATETGITIHVVDEQYDHGRHLRQEKCAVLATDTPETLAARVLQLEHQWFAPTVEAWVLGKKLGR